MLCGTVSKARSQGAWHQMFCYPSVRSLCHRRSLSKQVWFVPGEAKPALITSLPSICLEMAFRRIFQGAEVRLIGQEFPGPCSFIPLKRVWCFPSTSTGDLTAWVSWLFKQGEQLSNCIYHLSVLWLERCNILSILIFFFTINCVFLGKS